MRTFILIIICFVSISCIVADAQYRVNKIKYDYHKYSYQPGDPYNPGNAAFASLIVPGLGQMISGETGRGLGFMSGTTGCLAVAFTGLLISLNTTEPDPHFFEKIHIGMTLLYAGLAGTAGMWIWTVADASRVAKVNNMAMRDKRKMTAGISIHPYLNFPSDMTNNKSSAGLTININF